MEKSLAQLHLALDICYYCVFSVFRVVDLDVPFLLTGWEAT